jgi:2',3'-cyclic-nucleotide 2'-phosphodiesterase
MNPTLDILFFGDLVGKPGRKAVKAFLNQLADPADVVIANVENATHGYGISHSHYQDLMASGVNICTGGNHTWDRREILTWIDTATHFLRPDNLGAPLPGIGGQVFEVNGLKIGVINLIGQTFMGGYNSPWESADRLIPRLKAQCPVLFLDFHAETTAEKRAMAYHAASLGVSAMAGTHTHVQTADEQILKDQMGYITDAGFNGTYDSVIGMNAQSSLKRFRFGVKEHLDVAEAETLQVNAIRYTIDTRTGACLSVRRIHQLLSTPAVASVA